MALNLSASPHFSSLNCTESEYLDALHQVFKADLVTSRASWAPSNCTVIPRRSTEIEGRYASFWHVVSEGGPKDIDRTTNFERCRRIHWIRPLLDSFNAIHPGKGDGAEIKWWIQDQTRTKFDRYVIATHDFEYLVFIEDKIDYAMLVTAFDAGSNGRRRKHEKEWEKYWQK